MTLPCFAKINWILKILGKRPDGYHELRTILQTVGLCDRLSLEARPGDSVELEVHGYPAPADPSNLVLRAAELLRPFACSPCGLRLVLEKRIPLGAGLGGGSSDAAVTLMALNRLWGCGLDRDRLSRMAARLGSDVPFFLQGGMAAASGRGEVLRPLPSLRRCQALLLLYPGLEISAAHAYSLGNWEVGKEASVLTSEGAETKIQRFCQAAQSRQGLWSALENDFEGPLYKHFPALRQARDILMEAGCSATLISGSGSTVLGLAVPGQLEMVRRKAERLGAEALFLCRTISRKEYWKRLSRGGLEISSLGEQEG